MFNRKYLEEFKEFYDDDENLLIYSYDAKTKCKPNGVLFVHNHEDVYKLIRLANRYEFNVIARGKGTFGNTTLDSGVVIDFSKMNHIIYFDPDKKMVSVQSGVLIKELNKFLSRFNYSVSDSDGTVGGYLASNPVLGLVHELVVIDGTGKAFRTKNINDFLGNNGVNGLIVEATIMLDKETSLLKTVSKNKKYDPNGVLQ